MRWVKDNELRKHKYEFQGDIMKNCLEWEGIRHKQVLHGISFCMEAIHNEVIHND